MPSSAANASRIPQTVSSNSNIRARYYSRLGIFPPTPPPPPQGRPTLVKDNNASFSTASTLSLTSHSSSSDSSISSISPKSSVSFQAPQLPVPHSPTKPSAQQRKPPSCLRNKRSVLHATPAKHQRVSFFPEVRLYRIKSHEDYSDEEWENMWVDAETLDYEKARNAFEYQADGADWHHATEEDNFYRMPNGSLVHPATWYAYRRHWELTGTSPVEGTTTTKVNFGALLAQAQQQQHSRKRTPPPPKPVDSSRRDWSPPPNHNRRKVFWLLDLAIQSVQRGQEEARKSRQQLESRKHHKMLHNQTNTNNCSYYSNHYSNHNTVVDMMSQPSRCLDGGWP